MHVAQCQITAITKDAPDCTARMTVIYCQAFGRAANLARTYLVPYLPGFSPC
jgi:hypothetical protein